LRKLSINAREWRVKASLLFCLLACCFGPTTAFAKTGIYALDDPAIAVKNPKAIPLVTITRVGQRLFAVGLHGVILFSEDNGDTWRQAAVPVDVTLTAIYFKSEREGWAVGHFGVILHTVDGGLTWTSAVDGLDIIKALNSAAAQAQSAAPDTPDTALKVRVATAYQKAGPSKPFLAVGPCGNGILAVGQQDIAMFSADGGKTWQEWTSSIDNPTFRDIYAIASADGSPLLIGEDGLVLRGDPNCKNFKPLPGPYTATLFGAINRKPSDLMFVGIDGSAYLSNDNGTKWNTLSFGNDKVIDSGLLLGSGRMLLGFLDGSLYLSDDNLQNFRQTSAFVPFEIADMAVAPDGNLVVVGNGGIRIIPSTSIR
jgi:photosystem II stability/assembly factor-like uncharacterized protein